MQSTSYRLESRTATSKTPPSLLMCEIFPDSASLPALISSIVDRPAHRLALTITGPDKGQPTHVTSSPKFGDLSGRWNTPDISCSKTWQQLPLPLGPDQNPTPRRSSTPSLKWGTVGSTGELLPHPQQEQIINVIGSSCWENMWPTLTKADGGKTSSPYGQVALGNHPLIFGDRKDRPKMSKSRAGDGLSTKAGQAQRELLNPTWCEGLMGFPAGWTDTAPLPPENYLDWEQATLEGRWWVSGMSNQVDPEERGLPRTIPAKSVPKRNARIAALGNALVPAQLALFLRLILDN